MTQEVGNDFEQVVDRAASKIEQDMHKVLTNMGRGLVDPSSDQAKRIQAPNTAMEKVASIIKNNLEQMDDTYKLVLFELNDKVSHIILTSADNKILYDSMKDTVVDGDYDVESREYRAGPFVHRHAADVSLAAFKAHYMDALSKSLKASPSTPVSGVKQNPTQ